MVTGVSIYKKIYSDREGLSKALGTIFTNLFTIPIGRVYLETRLF